MKIFVINIKDKEIYLTKERWLHIIKEHPEIINYIQYLEEILQNPTKILDYERDKKVKYYYKYYKEKSQYLLTIVKYLNGKGFIITAYFVGKIK